MLESENLLESDKNAHIENVTTNRRTVTIAETSFAGQMEHCESANPVLNASNTDLKHGSNNRLLDVLPSFKRIPGWLTVVEGQLLFSYAQSVKTGCILEVGSYRGRSTAALCAGTSIGGEISIFAIEPHEHFLGVKGAKFGPDDRREFFKNMIDTKMTQYVRLINSTSAVLSVGWRTPISVLFLDGDRRYESVLADFEAWVPHLKHEAFVLFADADDDGPKGVIAQYESRKVLEFIERVGNIRVFQFFIGRDVPQVYPSLQFKGSARQANLDLETISYNVYYGGNGKYLYQSIPKCACTTIKTILLELEGLHVDDNEWLRHQKEKNKFPGVQGMAPERLLALFGDQTDTFKFVIVRNPYTRVASAYRDKIRMDIKPRSPYWRNLIRDAAARQELRLSEDITFEEFLWVVTSQSVEEMDPHWRPQYFEGRFGFIKFNFIGHLEMLDSDLTYVLQKIDAPERLVRRAKEQHNVAGTTTDIWETVSDNVKKRVAKTFQIDFDVLRYPNQII